MENEKCDPPADPPAPIERATRPVGDPGDAGDAGDAENTGSTGNAGLSTIELADGLVLAVLHADTGCLAVDKPAGWRPGVPPGVEPGAVAPTAADLPDPAPDLEQALNHAIQAGAPWAAERAWTQLRTVLPIETAGTGIFLLARSGGAQTAYAQALDRRPSAVEYLAVVGGKPSRRKWTCCLKISPDPGRPGRVLTHTTRGQHAHTDFTVLAHGDGMALLLVRPRTFRAHQIRAHLAAVGLPILGDTLYGFGRAIPSAGRRGRLVERMAPDRHRDPGSSGSGRQSPLALRLVRLAFQCPYENQALEITAPFDEFLARFGFETGEEAGDPEDSDGFGSLEGGESEKGEEGGRA
jgi:23S rRNA-/tRNA-specific pseudouridylate synthase